MTFTLGGVIMRFVAVGVASVLGAGVLVSGPAAGATYPPLLPIRCGVAVEGRTIVVQIRPRGERYKFEVIKRFGKKDWRAVDSGRTRASDGRASVTVKPGRYRVKCFGGATRLDGVTSSARVR